MELVHNYWSTAKNLSEVSYKNATEKSTESNAVSDNTYITSNMAKINKNVKQYQIIIYN